MTLGFRRGAGLVALGEQLVQRGRNDARVGVLHRNDADSTTQTWSGVVELAGEGLDQLVGIFAATDQQAVRSRFRQDQDAEAVGLAFSEGSLAGHALVHESLEGRGQLCGVGMSQRQYADIPKLRSHGLVELGD